MAKYTITYKCGHEVDMQLYGKCNERERKIAYYKTIDCPECQAKAAKAEAAKLQNEAVDNGLPMLEGSDKQIVWADKIRKTAIKNFEDFRNHAGNKEIVDVARDYILSHTKASFWIDERYTFEADSLKSFVKGVSDLCDEYIKEYIKTQRK